VVVLDLTMPGTDGWDVLAVLRCEGGHRPKVAVVTAHADESVEILARAAGADVYLAKPLDAADLRGAIGRLLVSGGKPIKPIFDDTDFAVAVDRLLSSSY
jgi:DNA-binding response OmpR family regulator